MNTLPRTAKPAALGPTDIKAVMDVGAPSYASGAHIWKGTAAILKENATAKRIIESISDGVRGQSVLHDDTAQWP